MWKSEQFTYGGTTGGAVQYSANESCLTGLVKLIKSTPWFFTAEFVEFLLPGIGGGGTIITPLRDWPEL